MSTCYAPLMKITAGDLFDGRLEEFGVREHVTPETAGKSRSLTDGRNYVEVCINEDGFIDHLTRRGGNAPGKILNAVADAFDTDVVSEYEAQYWGFDTQEERDAWQMEEHRKDEEEFKEKFYIAFLKFLRGEANDIKPGTCWMSYADIAKSLVEKDPSFLLPENRYKLLNEMQSIYDGDHTITVTLSPQDIALADMIATHEDDLPRA